MTSPSSQSKRRRVVTWIWIMAGVVAVGMTLTGVMHGEKLWERFFGDYHDVIHLRSGEILYGRVINVDQPSFTITVLINGTYGVKTISTKDVKKIRYGDGWTMAYPPYK